MKSLVFSILLVFSSCTSIQWMFVEKTIKTQHFKSQNEWPEDLRNQHSLIRKSDSTYINSKNTFIITWTDKHKDAYVGEYRMLSSHFGQYQFFIYSNDEFKILTRDSLPTLLSDIDLFMTKHKFGNRKIKKTKKTIVQKWNILDSNSW